MKIFTRKKLIVAGLLIAAITTYGYHTMTTPSWQTVSTTFMKNDKPYGGGNCRIKGDSVISLKLADPEITFKPVNERKNPDYAEPTQAWMGNVSEVLNRSTVSFFRGTIAGGLTRYFQQSGQDAAWAHSPDWGTQYISTDWMDYKRADHEEGLAPHITKLWRSGDGGKTWTQLTWPENQNIGQLLFLDSVRGYAIGWGPHVWRTADGGRSWKEIRVPHPARAYDDPRKTFDGVDLGPDGVLRVVYYVADAQSSVVERLTWDKEAFEEDTRLPGQTVVSLQSSAAPPGHAYTIYALSRLGLPRNWHGQSDNGHRTGAISSWANYQKPVVNQIHTFDARLTLDGLSVGQHGVILVYATDATGSGAPHDFTLASKDYGKSWDKINDGITQGVYFDPETNTQYGLYAYTLKKRHW